MKWETNFETDSKRFSKNVGNSDFSWWRERAWLWRYKNFVLLMIGHIRWYQKLILNLAHKCRLVCDVNRWIINRKMRDTRMWGKSIRINCYVCRHTTQNHRISSCYLLFRQPRKNKNQRKNKQTFKSQIDFLCFTN